MKRAKQKDETKHAAILQAAMRLFPKHGYELTSMDKIADAANVTKQTVYAHYQSKDELFKQMIIAMCEKHSLARRDAATPELPVAELLYRAGVSFLNFVTSDECLSVTRLVIAEVGRHPKLAHRYYEEGTQRLMTDFAGFLKEQNRRGALSIPDPESASSYFFALLKGRYYLRMILSIKPAPTLRDKETDVRETVDVFLRIYGGKNALHTRRVL